MVWQRSFFCLFASLHSLLASFFCLYESVIHFFFWVGQRNRRSSKFNTTHIPKLNGLKIDFAYRTKKKTNETRMKKKKRNLSRVIKKATTKIAKNALKKNTNLTKPEVIHTTRHIISMMMITTTFSTSLDCQLPNF